MVLEIIKHFYQAGIWKTEASYIKIIIIMEGFNFDMNILKKAGFESQNQKWSQEC